MAGYDTYYFLRNIGTTGVIFVLYPVFMLVAYAFQKSLYFKNLGRRMQKSLYWNSWIGWTDDAYLNLVVSITLNLVSIN